MPLRLSRSATPSGSTSPRGPSTGGSGRMFQRDPDRPACTVPGSLRRATRRTRFRQRLSYRRPLRNPGMVARKTLNPTLSQREREQERSQIRGPRELCKRLLQGVSVAAGLATVKSLSSGWWTVAGDQAGTQSPATDHCLPPIRPWRRRCRGAGRSRRRGR